MDSSKIIEDCTLHLQMDIHYVYPRSQSTYIYRAPQCMFPRRNWASPNPSPASKCALPPTKRWGGHTRRRLKGWGSPNSDDWRKSLALCLLCAPDNVSSTSVRIHIHLYMHGCPPCICSDLTYPKECIHGINNKR